MASRKLSDKEQVKKSLTKILVDNVRQDKFDAAGTTLDLLARLSGLGDPMGLNGLEIALVRQSKVIDAIKEHRNRTGMGLKESKDLVDKWRRDNNVPIPNAYAQP